VSTEKCVEQLRSGINSFTCVDFVFPLVTFSPYWLYELGESLPERIGEFKVEISPYPAYGMMTQTLVMRK